MDEPVVKAALITGGAAAGAALMARRFPPKMQGIDWEQRIAAMPDTARQADVHQHQAIRDNSDRILELLEEQRERPEREAR